MEIRKFVNSRDRSQVKELWTNIFGYKDKRNDPEFSIDKKLKVDDLLLVAEDAEKIIGTVMGGYDGHRGWIYSLAVDKSFQGKGLGSKLLKAMEGELIKIGCCKINLQILASNSEAKEFYSKNGYRVEERVSMGKVIHENIEL